jgi:hypothetical protein
MSFFNFVVDADCPPDTVYFVDTSKFAPLWITKDGTEYWHASHVSNRHLREIIDDLLLLGSKQYWCRVDISVEATLFAEISSRGLWTDAEELQSRLEGVVKRESR